MSIAFICSFVTYLLLLLGVGVFFYRKQKNNIDFMVGGRSLNYWVTAIAAHATDMSTWLFMAFPGIIYREGLFAGWTAIGLLVGMFFTWNMIAPKLRIATEKKGSLTLPSFFEDHFNDKTGLIRILSATISIVFFMFYISSGIVGLGRTLEVTFLIDYHLGITVGTIVIATYTLLGGFLAVAWGDFMQGLFVIFIIIGVPVYACMQVGGVGEVLSVIQSKGISLSLFPDYSLGTFWHIITLVLGWGLGYFGLPHILVNFMGIDDVKNMKKARNVGMVWQIISLIGAACIGLIGIAFFAQGGLEQSEFVFIVMAKSLFVPFVAGFVLCAILAASITTMDSQILVSTSILSEDLYKRFFNKNISSRKSLAISRASGLGITLIAFLLAFNNNNSLLDLVYYAWSGLGGAFGPLIIAIFYVKSITKQGAIAGMIVGAVTSGIWPHLNTPIPRHAALIPAFIASFAIMFIVSAFTRHKVK